MWGEHQGILKLFREIYDDTKHCSDYCQHERNDYFGNNEDPNQWIANLTPTNEYVDQAIVASVKSFLANLYSQYQNSHDIIGFKEVRYGQQELELLRKCYPEAIIFLLIRNPVEIWKSIPDNWPISNHIEKYITTWIENSKFYIKMDQEDKRAYLIRFEDLVAKDSQTVNLISRLAQLSKAQINDVLRHKIGSTKNKMISAKDEAFILKNCQEIMELIGYQV
ncbi:sulfotransferase [Natroniella sulfidigena]|nr:sulfotransferase [Natroniella sulfidigena]